MGHDDAGAELHPLYGTAIHTGGRTLSGSGCDWSSGHCCVDDNVYLHPEADPLFDVPQNPNDDTWAIWLANYGDGEYCSSRGLDLLPMPTLSFRLPWAKDETGAPMGDVEVLSTTNFALHAAEDVGTNGIYDVAIDPGDSVVITFHMPPSDAQPYFFGELHLKWHPLPGSQIANLPPVVLTPASCTRVQMSPQPEENPLMTAMSPAQKRIFVAEVKKSAKVAPSPAKMSIMSTRRMVAPSARPQTPARLSVGKPSSLSAAPEDIVTRRALCAAYRGRVPKQPSDFCKQNRSKVARRHRNSR